MLRSARNTLRLLLIARILARHNALSVLSGLDQAAPVLAIARLLARRDAIGRPGQRLALALQEAGPSFIKLGQALSTRSDLLGEDVAADLSDLRDRLPPFPEVVARRIIEDELGRPMSALFRTFDDEPVAAASIAQVHLAVDLDGREVAVKVLRPGIEAAFKRDLDLFLWVATAIETALPNARRLKPVESVRTFAATVEMEMDLRFEAAAACELAENFAGDPSFKVPFVDWTRTGKHVLTTERIAGLSLDEREAILAAGLDPPVVLARAARAFFLQVFRDGFFHGDLHAGNLFVQADGTIAVVDFGIMGRLDAATRQHLGGLLMAFLARDYRRAAEIHRQAGSVPESCPVAEFAQACRSIGEPILDKPQNEISVARLLGQLFQVTSTFEMETQPQLLLLQKTMLVAEGTGRHLCPDANMWFLARPLIQDWISETTSAEAILRQRLRSLLETLTALPDSLRRFEVASSQLSRAAARLDTSLAAPQRGRPAPVFLAAGAVGAVIGASMVLLFAG